MKLEFAPLDVKLHFEDWLRLYWETAGDFTAFRGFADWHARLFRGAFRFFQTRVQAQPYGVFARIMNERRLVATATHFKARDPSLNPTSSLGCFFIGPGLELDELREFAGRLLEVAGPEAIAPFNGHMNWGLNHPELGTDASRITFLCAAGSRQLDRLFYETGLFRQTRRQHALLMPVTQQLKDEVANGVADLKERGFDSRPLSFTRLKRDMAIYHRIASGAMRDHIYFSPLTFDEEWELMRVAPIWLKPSWFRFLMHGEREIGFCFGVPDYNQILSNERSDLANFTRLQSARFRPRMVQRARLIYKAILPEYQGQGLIKAVRHRVLQEMISDGISEIDGSYIDEANVRSLRNTQGTGGQISHSFALFKGR